jgi:uncharacterized protein UPF0158
MQIMPTVSLDQLQNAMEWASSDFLDNEVYICRRSGKIVWISGDPGMIDEEEIPEDIHDCDRYVRVPDKRDLDLGNQLAFDFAARYLAQHYDDIRDMFRRKGAYRRFKDLLERKKMLEKWYAYCDEQATKALREWRETEGLSLRP